MKKVNQLKLWVYKEYFKLEVMLLTLVFAVGCFFYAVYMFMVLDAAFHSWAGVLALAFALMNDVRLDRIEEQSDGSL